jgi:hypothetical protein
LAGVISSQLMACFSGWPVDPVVRLVDRHSRDGGRRLQHGGFHLARLDRGDRVRAPVEPDDDDLAEPRGFERRHGAERHRVVAGDDALDVAIALNECLHFLKCLVLAPVRALAADHLQTRVLVDDVVIPAASDAGVGVRLLADELHVRAGFAHQPHELLRAHRRALVVVRDNLRGRHAARVDLAIDQEHGNARLLRLGHRGDRRVRAGVVEDDRGYFPRDRDVHHLILLVGIVVVRADDGLVAELARPGGGALRLGFEERVVVRRRDHRDALRPAVGRRRRRAAPAPRDAGQDGRQNERAHLHQRHDDLF